MLKTRFLNQGFTLVELMVVVAIIGILAAIAIPNFQSYQAKSRQSEAKITLAGVYTAEKSYQVEKSSFTACLSSIGVSVEGNGTNSFYTTGFAAAAVAGSCATTDPATGTPTCASSAGVTHFLAGRPAAGLIASLPASAATCNATTFVAGAGGVINARQSSAAADVDQWTMNQDRSLTNTQTVLK